MEDDRLFGFPETIPGQLAMETFDGLYERPGVYVDGTEVIAVDTSGNTDPEAAARELDRIASTRHYKISWTGPMRWHRFDV